MAGSIKIDHSGFCNKDFAKIHGNELFSDITLVVNGKQFHCHKIILATRSIYFNALLTGGLNESNQREVTIVEQNLETFEKLLQYIYTGRITMARTLEEILEMLRLANKYLFPALQEDIVFQLIRTLNVNNFCTVFAAAHRYSIMKLKDKCFQFLLQRAKAVLDVDRGFETLTVDTAQELIGNLAFKSLQVEVYQAVYKWALANGRQNAPPLLDKIVLSEMPIAFLVGTVRRGRLFPESAILDAIAIIEGISTGPTEEANVNMQIFVRMPTGKTAVVSVNAASTIEHVKLEIEKKTGFDREHMKLRRTNGLPLMDDCTVGDYKIEKESTLFCDLKKNVEN